MSDFFEITTPKARQPYTCEWCFEEIPRGEVHCKANGKYQGDWQDWRMHRECNAAFARTKEPEFFPGENKRGSTEHK